MRRTNGDPSDDEPIFEPAEDMTQVELVDMVKGYVSVSDRQQLITLLAWCRELFFDGPET
jgi:hypothetical protein